MELNEMIIAMAKTADQDQARRFANSLAKINTTLSSAFKVAWCAYQAKESWAKAMMA